MCLLSDGRPMPDMHFLINKSPLQMLRCTCRAHELAHTHCKVYMQGVRHNTLGNHTYANADTLGRSIRPWQEQPPETRAGLAGSGSPPG